MILAARQQELLKNPFACINLFAVRKLHSYIFRENGLVSYASAADTQDFHANLFHLSGFSTRYLPFWHTRPHSAGGGDPPPYTKLQSVDCNLV
jgi:hypothetical protein